MTLPKFHGRRPSCIVPRDPVPWIGLVLIVLAALMLIEAIRILFSLGTPPTAKLEDDSGRGGSGLTAATYHWSARRRSFQSSPC